LFKWFVPGSAAWRKVATNAVAPALKAVQSSCVRSLPARSFLDKEVVMDLIPHISPIAALIAGILILIFPQTLNYVVAIYLIVTGLIGLNDIYHWMK
jgi:hypothetical protein